MELQILDADYVVIQNKPIIRLFCKNEKGETICVFYDKFLPYFYVHAEDDKYPAITEEIKRKFDIVGTEVVEKKIPIGYQPPVKVLKVITKTPNQVRDMRDFVKQFGTPYEADILFRYRFMSDFGLKGMGWINVEGTSTRTNTVKCKAIKADKITPIERMTNAPLRYMGLDIECLSTGERIPTPEKDNIIMVSLAFNPTYKGKSDLVIISKSGKTNGNTIMCNSEEEMLGKLKEVIDEYDPDIMCGHNINGFDIPFLLKRMEMLNVRKDMGRSEKLSNSRKLSHSYIPSISGRIVIDTFEVYKRDPWVKFKRYDLNTIAMNMLGEGKIEMEGNFLAYIKNVWSGNDFRELVDYARKDAILTLRLVVEKRLLNKFFEIAKLSGLLLQDTFGGQSQRHERRLLEEFYKRDFIMPCKPGDENVAGRHGLKGALVLEPEIGFHEWVVCLDFTSMYPSLISAFNICTTTFLTNGDDVEHFVSPYGTKFVKPKVFRGIIPEIVDEVMAARKEVKQKYKKETDEEMRRILEAKQLALKDLLNSLYGYTGYARSRLYVMDIANTITAFGRETITKTRELIEKNFNVKVIY